MEREKQRVQMFNPHIAVGSQQLPFYLYLCFFLNPIFNLSIGIAEEQGNPNSPAAEVLQKQENLMTLNIINKWCCVHM